MFRRGLVWLLVFSTLEIASPGMPAQRSRGIPQYYAAFASKEDRGRTTLARLRNGLSIVVEEQSVLPLACLVTYVRADHTAGKYREAGSFYEFLLEAVSSLPFELRSLGGSFEVQTKLDHTAIVSVFPPEKLPEAMAIHARALALKDLSREKLAGALELFHSSRQAPVPTPVQLDRNRLWDIAYPEWGGSAAALELDGEFAGPGRTSLEDLQVYRSIFHVPERVILSVSGAIFRENVLREAAELFAGVSVKPSEKGTVPDVAKFGPAEASFAYRFVREGRPSHSLRFGFRIPDASDGDAMAVRMLVTILASGRGSLLGRYAMESGFLRDWEGGFASLPGGGLVEIVLQPAPDRVDAAEVEVLALLQALAKKGPTPADLDRGRAILVKEHFRRQEMLEVRAYEMARWQAVGTYPSLDEVPDRIVGVTGEGVRAVAEKYFGESSICLLELFPSGSEKREFTAQTLQETLRLLLPNRVEKILEEQDSVRSLQPKTTFSLPEFRPELVRYDLRKTSVLRGPEIYLEERHLVPVVHVGFYLPGGRLDEEQWNSGITEVMLESILDRFSSGEGRLAWLEFEKMGGSVEIVNEPDFFGFQVSVLSRHLIPVMEWFQKFLVPEGLADPEFERSRNRVLARARRREVEPGAVVRSEIRQKLFRGHPYSFDRRGTQQSLEKLDVPAVWAWTRRQLESFHPTIIIRGDVAGTSFLPPMIQVLSSSQFKPKEKTVKSPGGEGADAAWATAPGLAAVGFQGPVLGSRDAWVLDLLGQLTALMQEKTVPEERLWQGSFARVRFETRVNQNAGGIYLDLRVPPGDEKKALSVLAEGLSRFTTTIVRREDFLGSVVATITRFYADQQDGRSSVLRLARDFLAGEKTDYRNEYLTTIKGVDLEEIRTLGRRFFRVSQLSLPAGQAQ